MSSYRWRLIDTGYADGPTNMAIDEAILRACAEGEVPPTLRLYGWAPPCLSIGYFQSAGKEVSLEECRRLGVDLVRRLTGGLAVLHDRELTYTVVLPASHPLAAGGIVDSYRRLSAGLAAGIAALGVQVEMAPQGTSRHNRATGGDLNTESATKTSACFELPSDFEITVDKRKLVGSAQTRKRGVVLQHGSVLLAFDAFRTAAVLKAPSMTKDEYAALLQSRTISLQEAVGRVVGYEEAAIALVRGFEQALGITLERCDLARAERTLADELREVKYASAEWTLRR